jgi:hypothetical protein
MKLGRGMAKPPSRAALSKALSEFSGGRRRRIQVSFPHMNAENNWFVAT